MEGHYQVFEIKGSELRLYIDLTGLLGKIKINPFPFFAFSIKMLELYVLSLKYPE